MIGSVEGNIVAVRRRRRISGRFAGLAVIAGVIALADPSSHSSYVLVQNLNPYFIGAFSIAAAVTAGAFSSGRLSERWAGGILRGCVAVGLPHPPTDRVSGHRAKAESYPTDKKERRGRRVSR